MLCIRNFKTFCNVIGNNVNIRSGSGIMEDSVIRALKVWGNGGHFVDDVDGSFHPPVALDMMQFDAMTRAVDTISECIHSDPVVEWEIRTGRKDSERQQRAIGAKGPKSKDVLENMAEEAVNMATGLRRELYDARCENTRLQSVNDNLQEQIVREHQELKDAVTEVEEEEDLVACILYTRAYDSTRKETSMLRNVTHFGFLPRENAMLVLAYWAGKLDTAKAPGFTCVFLCEGLSNNCVVWNNGNVISSTNFLTYELLLEPAPTYISGADTVDMYRILDKLNDEFQVTIMPDSGTLDRSLGGSSA